MRAVTQPRLLTIPIVLLFAFLLAGCQPAPARIAETQRTAASDQPTAPRPTLDPLFRSNGGGEPRGASYWLLWNTCAEGNQSGTAKANGGRSAGWILLDDLLEDPGIRLGPLEIKTCAQAVDLLRGSPAQAGDTILLPFYRLAAEVMAAQLNMAVPTETCPAAEQAVLSGQLLLVSTGYSENNNKLAPKDPQKDSLLAEFLTRQLASYNIGQLCQDSFP